MDKETVIGLAKKVAELRKDYDDKQTTVNSANRIYMETPEFKEYNKLTEEKNILEDHLKTCEAELKSALSMYLDKEKGEGENG